jgi:hypothetical protein
MANPATLKGQLITRCGHGHERILIQRSATSRQQHDFRQVLAFRIRQMTKEKEKLIFGNCQRSCRFF